MGAWHYFPWPIQLQLLQHQMLHIQTCVPGASCLVCSSALAGCHATTSACMQAGCSTESWPGLHLALPTCTLRSLSSHVGLCWFINLQAACVGSCQLEHTMRQFDVVLRCTTTQVGYRASKEVFGHTWDMTITAGEAGPVFTVRTNASCFAPFYAAAAAA